MSFTYKIYRFTDNCISFASNNKPHNNINMKNLRFSLILAISVFMFQSCNNDDEGVSASKADLIGLWTTNEINLDLLIDGNIVENDSITTIFEAGQETIEFKDDNTYISNDGTIDIDNGTWSLNSKGDLISFEPENSAPYQYEITSIATNQLKIKFEEDFTAFADLFGLEFEEDVIIVGNITLTK